MKNKRHTTEDKIRILREADGGKSITEVYGEHNISLISALPPRKGRGNGVLAQSFWSSPCFSPFCLPALRWRLIR